MYGRVPQCVGVAQAGNSLARERVGRSPIPKELEGPIESGKVVESTVDLKANRTADL